MVIYVDFFVLSVDWYLVEPERFVCASCGKKLGVEEQILCSRCAPKMLPVEPKPEVERWALRRTVMGLVARQGDTPQSGQDHRIGDIVGLATHIFEGFEGETPDGKPWPLPGEPWLWWDGETWGFVSRPYLPSDSRSWHAITPQNGVALMRPRKGEK